MEWGKGAKGVNHPLPPARADGIDGREEGKVGTEEDGAGEEGSLSSVSSNRTLWGGRRGGGGGKERGGMRWMD
uniref:Uncharacterized protein n=1 Tax=Loa loa TaxID=7209 RepID=A0A1I7VPU1_LOALO